MVLGIIHLKRKMDGRYPTLLSLILVRILQYIPKRIWSILPVNKLAEHYTKGLVPKPECKLDVGVGEINIILLDSDTRTKKYRVLSFLAPTDDIPLIIGFKNLLSEFKVHFDYKENKAWIEESL